MRLIGLAFVLAFGLLAPLDAQAQPATKIPRIGLLDSAEFWDALRQALSQLGYVEGKTIELDYRSSGGHVERLPELARQLVQHHVDVIVTFGTPVTQAAKQATSTIPIVMVGVGESVKVGLVAGLARPSISRRRRRLD
jgi:putative ABC transport system substrate-binding protein